MPFSTGKKPYTSLLPVTALISKPFPLQISLTNALSVRPKMIVTAESENSVFSPALRIFTSSGRISVTSLISSLTLSAILTAPEGVVSSHMKYIFLSCVNSGMTNSYRIFL